MKTQHVSKRLPIGAAALLLLPCFSWAAQSASHMINEQVVNAAGNTYSSSSKLAYDSFGEALTGQIWGLQFHSVQAGFFNKYYLPPPTATPTIMMTITMTPIRYFNGELLSQEYVYAAPNPMRGTIGNIYFDLAQPAEVLIKIVTISNNLVISQHWDSLPAGKNKWIWNTTGMANGVYLLYIKAKSDDGKTSHLIKKLALIK